jgi:biopolymer transport protein ExbB
VLPILGFGLLATLIAVSKSVQFLRLPRIVSLGAMVDAVNLASKMPKGPQRDIIEIVLANDDAEERDDLLFALLIEEKSRLERFLGAIAVTATVSPLLGLLGTVSGMISTFNMMTLFGAGDPSIVSGGISEALITTELGLVVAIPALIMHALLTRKANSYIESLESSAILMTQAPGRAR